MDDLGAPLSSLSGLSPSGRLARVVAEERPVAGVRPPAPAASMRVGHVVAVGDAVAVGHDHRGAGEAVGLLHGVHGLHVLGRHGHPGHVGVAVGHGQHGQVLLLDRLAGHGELGRRAHGRGLGGLAAGVGVDLGVEHQDVHVPAHGDDVVEAAVADVVGPAVAADDPDALLHQVVGDLLEPARRRAGPPRPAWSGAP